MRSLSLIAVVCAASPLLAGCSQVNNAEATSSPEFVPVRADKPASRLDPTELVDPLAKSEAETLLEGSGSIPAPLADPGWTPATAASDQPLLEEAGPLDQLPGASTDELPDFDASPLAGEDESLLRY